MARIKNSGSPRGILSIISSCGGMLKARSDLDQWRDSGDSFSLFRKCHSQRVARQTMIADRHVGITQCEIYISKSSFALLIGGGVLQLVLFTLGSGVLGLVSVS